MSRVVIDMTELAGWQGKLTGVPRVMNELCRRFARPGNEVVFAAWNGAAKCLEEVEYSPRADTEVNIPGQEGLYAASGWLVQAKDAYRRFKRSSALAEKTLALPERAARKVLDRRSASGADPANALQLQGGDVLFIMADWHGSDPNFVEYLRAASTQGVVLVQMVYDLLPLVAPQYSGHATDYLTRYVKAVYPLCSTLIAISEHTKRDVTQWLQAHKLSAPSIRVIRLGDDFQAAKAAKPAAMGAFGLGGGDYLLCVGTIEARKNHMLLYYTYKLAKSRGVQLPKLVIVGRRGWQAENIYEIITHDPEVKDDFAVLESVNDNELSWLYEHCLFSVYPSFYEGWGLPIAESIARGVPCISSNTSSMPEIAGGLVRYFSPYSPEECLAAIQNLLGPGAIKAARGKIKKYNPISWDETYKQVDEAIKETHVKD